MMDFIVPVLIALAAVGFFAWKKFGKKKNEPTVSATAPVVSAPPPNVVPLNIPPALVKPAPSTLAYIGTPVDWKPAPGNVVHDGVLRASGQWQPFKAGINTFPMPGVKAGQRISVEIAGGYQPASLSLLSPDGVPLQAKYIPAGAGSVEAVAPVDGDYSVSLTANDNGTVNHWRS